MRSPDYSAADILRTVRGISTTQAALLPELASMDLARTLPRLDVPVVMVQGRHDQVAPGTAAQRYVNTLQAPGKRLVWFDNERTRRIWKNPASSGTSSSESGSQGCSRTSPPAAGSHDRSGHERGTVLDALRRRRPTPAR